MHDPRAATAAPLQPATALEKVAARIDHHSTLVREAVLRLEGLANRAFGPSPPDGVAAKPTAVPNGVLSDISDKFEEQARLISRLENIAERLDQLG